MAANRMLRNWTFSEKVDKLTPKAEVFFTRLIMTVDNFGCYFAAPILLKSALYPLKEKMKSDEIVPLLKECEAAGIIQIYSAGGKQYVHILNFDQRLYNTSKRQYPEPPPIENEAITADVNKPPHVPAAPSGPPLELNRIESELNKNSNVDAISLPPSTKKLSLEERRKAFYEKLVPYVAEYGAPMVRAFFNYWAEANEGGTKMLFEMKKTFEIKRRFVTWKSNESKFESGNNFKKQENGTTETRVRASEKI